MSSDFEQVHSVIRTGDEEFPLVEHRFRSGDHEWSIFSTGVIVTLEQEQDFFRDLRDHVPYGVGLWPSAMALSHEIVERADEFRGKRVLELGAGTGLPGIVAATMGAHVVQTDNRDMILTLCKLNGERNGAPPIDYHLADWIVWDDTTQYDWIIAADIVYNGNIWTALQRIFENNLAPGGNVLLADPLRGGGAGFIPFLESHKWTIQSKNREVQEGEYVRTISMFEMTPPSIHTPRSVLRTSAGDFPLDEFRFRVGGHKWGILSTGALMTLELERKFIMELRDRIPYGVALWPSGIALANEIAERADEFGGKRVLELGAGTGIAGIVAATVGAQVVQTDNTAVVLTLCKINGERNGNPPIEYRLADWTAWDDTTQYDWIIGSDIVYNGSAWQQLQHIFENNLAPDGKILLGDPLRDINPQFLDHLDSHGWTIMFSRTELGDADNIRTMGIFEIVPPGHPDAAALADAEQADSADAQTGQDGS